MQPTNILRSNTVIYSHMPEQHCAFNMLLCSLPTTLAERSFCFGPGHNQAHSGKRCSAGCFATVRSCTQTTPAECCTEDGANGHAERWTEMQADGSGWETINLTLTTGPLRNCIEAASSGICLCVCVCVKERHEVWLCAKTVCVMVENMYLI